MPAGACEAAHSDAACAIGPAVVCPSDALVDVNAAMRAFKTAPEALKCKLHKCTKADDLKAT